MNWYIAVLKKYATFSGRAQRAEYWYFVLFYILIFIGLSVVDGATGTYDQKAGMGMLGGLFALGMIIPSLAVAVRRLHDIGRSGWWFLIGFVPLIGAIVLIVFFVKDSAPGDNAYGPNPKAAAASAGSGPPAAG